MSPSDHVHRLLRRDHAELAEPRDIGGRHCFDVLDAMTPAARRRRVHSRRVLERVERHADRPIADGMDPDLPSARVHHRDDALEVLAAVVGRAG